MRLILADDHALVRRGIRHILEREFPSLQVAEAGTAEEVLGLLRTAEWDGIILDINLPGRSGLDLLGDLSAMRSAVPVLVVSMHPEEGIAVRALRAGAAGYLTKDSAPELLVGAVRRITGGGKFVTPQLAERLVAEFQSAGEESPHCTLSNREFEVFCQLAGGRRVGQIAEALCLSVKTVSTYRTRILEKMGMENNAELTAYALRHNLIG